MKFQGEKNYLDNLGTGYGWILILIGLGYIFNNLLCLLRLVNYGV
jgi:hypothetical protein